MWELRYRVTLIVIIIELGRKSADVQNLFIHCLITCKDKTIRQYAL